MPTAARPRRRRHDRAAARAQDARTPTSSHRHHDDTVEPRRPTAAGPSRARGHARRGDSVQSQETPTAARRARVDDVHCSAAHTRAALTRPQATTMRGTSRYSGEEEPPRGREHTVDRKQGSTTAPERER